MLGGRAQSAVEQVTVLHLTLIVCAHFKQKLLMHTGEAKTDNKNISQVSVFSSQVIILLVKASYILHFLCFLQELVEGSVLVQLENPTINAARLRKETSQSPRCNPLKQ